MTSSITDNSSVRHKREYAELRLGALSDHLCYSTVLLCCCAAPWVVSVQRQVDRFSWFYTADLLFEVAGVC